MPYQFVADLAPELAGAVMQEIDAMLAALTEQHGKAFTEGVVTMLTVRQIHSVLVMSGAPPEVLDIHMRLSTSMIRSLLKALDIDSQMMAIESEANRVLEKLSGFAPPGAALQLH